MSNMRLSEAIAALERGEEVEYYNSISWVSFTLGNTNCISSLINYEFRLKPKPMDIWVNVYEDGYTSGWTTKEKAYNAAMKPLFSGVVKRVAVLFREVVGEE